MYNTCSYVLNSQTYLFRSKFPWTERADVLRPEADAEMQGCLVWFEKEDAKGMVSVDELDFKKYLECESKTFWKMGKQYF